MTVNPAVRRAGELFARQTGTGTPEMIAAATAWAYHEGGNVVRFNNPWNLHGVKGNYGGLAIGDWYAGSGDVHVAKFATLEDGVAAAVMNLRAHGSDFAHYDAVLAAAKSGDGPAFLDALARSAWSAGRYGGPDHNALVPLYRQILPTITTAPSQPPTPEVPSVKPSALQTQPLLALGAAGTALSAIIVYLVDAKAVSADAGNALVQVAVLVLPLVLAAIGRQFVTPNVKVPPVVTPTVLSPVLSATDDFEYPTTDPVVLTKLQAIYDRGAADGGPPTKRDVWHTYQANLVRQAAIAKDVATATAAEAAAPPLPVTDEPQTYTPDTNTGSIVTTSGRFAPTAAQLAEMARTGTVPSGTSWGTIAGRYPYGSIAPAVPVPLDGPSRDSGTYLQQLFAIHAGQPYTGTWPSEATTTEWRRAQLVSRTAAMLADGDPPYGGLTADQVKYAADLASPFSAYVSGPPEYIVALWKAADMVSRDPSVLAR